MIGKSKVLSNLPEPCLNGGSVLSLLAIGASLLYMQTAVAMKLCCNC